MSYELLILRNHFIRQSEFFTPGEYRVPEDMSEDQAKKAIDAGDAKKLVKSSKPSEPIITRMKGAAPENKLAEAGEKKSGQSGRVKPLSSQPAASRKAKKP